MKIGTQYCAEHGYCSMMAGVTYYFIHFDSKNEKAMFCWFSEGRFGWRVYLTYLSSEKLDTALLSSPPLIVPREHQYKLPPWLTNMDGTNFDEIEKYRVSTKLTYRDQVNSRLLYIASLLSRLENVLTCNPMKQLAVHARQCNPPQNAHRIQLWFFAYIAHGQNIWALKKPTHNAGRWLRNSGEHKDRKFGRPSLQNGSDYGFPTHKMTAQIVKSYIKRCGLGQRMTDIHADACIEDYGCRIETKKYADFRMYHPQNEAFPSYYQFRHVVVEAFGLKKVQTTLYGAERVKHSLPHSGSFTERLSNLLESLEVDAYRVGERAKSMYSKNNMSTVCVARGICAGSGEIVGVGFSVGSETSKAYKAMLFSMAIPKSKLGQIFGVPITDEMWPAQGVGLGFTSDRGPGSKDPADALQEKFPIREMPPSYSGQGKALVESSQPKKTHFQGSKKHKVSSLTLVELCRREILRACKDNHTSTVTKRLTPNMVNHFKQHELPATPHNVWNYMSQRLRTDAVQISFDAAVRAFCDPAVFLIQDDGAWLGRRCYRSKQLSESKFLQRWHNGTKIEVSGYVVPMCVRYVWIEIEGQLLELEAVLRMRDDPNQLYMTMSELLAETSIVSGIESITRESVKAANSEFRRVLKETIGKDWDSGEMRAGPPKRVSGETAFEEQQLKEPASRVKRA